MKKMKISQISQKVTIYSTNDERQKSNPPRIKIDFIIISITNIMQIQDQYLLDLLAVLEPNIAHFNQSVINDEWDMGLPGFETTQLWQQIKHDQMYMQKIMHIIKQASVTPNDALLKSMLLLVVKRTVKGLDKNILKYCYEQMIYQNYQMQSAWLAKFFRRTIQIVLNQYARNNQIDYQQIHNKLVINLVNRTNLFTNLNIFVSLFKHNKFILKDESNQKRNQFLILCFSLCSQILKQNIQTSPTIVWVCCKLLCNAWAFPQAHTIFYPQNDHSTWMQCFLQILKSKWYIQNIEEKYKNLDSLESIYLHSKKSVVKGITNYIRKISRIKKQKKTKNKSKNKEKVEQNYNLILQQFLREIIEELEYDCYPEKIRRVQILLVREVVKYCSQYVNLECTKRCQSCLFKFMKVKPQEQEKIVLQPYQYEIQYRDYSFFNKNIRVLSASIWTQISFRKDKTIANLTSQSFQILKKLLNSTNLLEFQMALTVFSSISADMLKSEAQKNEPVFALNTHIKKMVSSSSVVIRVSAFRALSNVLDQNDLNCLAYHDFMNWIQLIYDHLTKDEAVLVRICAGICFLKLSRKEKCINQFKLIMYECLVVLLKIIQQVTLQQIGKLINQVLKIKQYEKIIMPLAKQILQYSLSSFVQILGNKIKKNANFSIDQEQDIDSLILMEECAQMISTFISNLNNNDLVPDGPIQSKISATFCTIFTLFQENNMGFQEFDQEGIESILKIFSAYLFRTEKCEQKILDLFVKKMSDFLPKFGMFSSINLLTPLINLTKHLQKNLNPSESLSLIIVVRQSLMNNQEKQFGDICLNLLDFYLITNVLSVPSIKKLCPQQFQLISNRVSMSLNQKYNVQNVKSLMMQNFNGQYRSAALGYSASVMCLYQPVITASGVLSEKQILQFANELFENLNKKIENSCFSQFSINLLPIFKIYILANLEILSRIIFNPVLTFKKQNEVLHSNLKAIPSEEISKLVSNLLLLFDKYIKNMENNELIIDYDNENENEDLGEEVECGQQPSMSGQDQYNEDNFMEEQQGQAQHGLEEFNFHKCFNRLEKMSQNHYLNKILQNKILGEFISEEQMQRLKKIKSKLDKISVQESEIVSMMLN